MPAGQPPTYSLTDQDILHWIQDLTLEPRNTPPAFTTTMWTTQAVVDATDEAQKNFLRRTGVTVARLGFDGDKDNSVPVLAGKLQVPKPQNLIDILRAAYVNYDTSVPPKVVGVQEMAREDAAALDWNDPKWESDLANTPPEYTESHTDPSEFMLAHPGSDIGAIDFTFVAVSSGLTGLGVPLNVPDECAEGVMWGALEILLSTEGEAHDPERAAFAHTMFEMYVALTQALLAAPGHVQPEG